MYIIYVYTYIMRYTRIPYWKLANWKWIYIIIGVRSESGITRRRRRGVCAYTRGGEIMIHLARTPYRRRFNYINQTVEIIIINVLRTIIAAGHYHYRYYRYRYRYYHYYYRYYTATIPLPHYLCRVYADNNILYGSRISRDTACFIDSTYYYSHREIRGRTRKWFTARKISRRFYAKTGN